MRNSGVGVFSPRIQGPASCQVFFLHPPADLINRPLRGLARRKRHEEEFSMRRRPKPRNIASALRARNRTARRLRPACLPLFCRTDILPLRHLVPPIGAFLDESFRLSLLP